MATAIAAIKQEGTNISLPLINEADFGFKVDAKQNKIYFSLKAMNGIGTEVVQTILANRPYKTMEDFGKRMLEAKYELKYNTETGKEEAVKIAPALIQTAQMIQLIKGGCFTELHSKDRKDTMDWFLKKYVYSPIDNLTMRQISKMTELDMIPENLKLSIRILNFKKYVLDEEGFLYGYVDPKKKKIPKCGYHDGRYILDDNSQPFFIEHFSEDSVVDIKGDYYVISEKIFEKETETFIKPLKEWMSNPETLKLYNEKLYQVLWDKYASGTLPHWSMQALCYYDEEHELEHVNEDDYGIVNFFDLPENPEPYEWYTRYSNGKPVYKPKYKISRIAGTVLNTDNNRHTVTLLTKYGTVNVKMNKGHYAFYNKRIKEKTEDGEKNKIIENSWLQRGNLIIVAGIRREDQFIPKIYQDTIYNHTVNLIKEVHEDGTLLLQSERTKVNE